MKPFFPSSLRRKKDINVCSVHIYGVHSQISTVKSIPEARAIKHRGLLNCNQNQSIWLHKDGYHETMYVDTVPWLVTAKLLDVFV